MRNLYHISFSKSLPTYMYPRQPQGLHNPDDITKQIKTSIFSENLPPRISFSPSVAECFRAIWPNIHKYFTRHKYPHMDMYVYALVKGNEKLMLTPKQMTENNQLWDAFFTREHCFLSKVKVVKVAKVRIFNPLFVPAILDETRFQYKVNHGIKEPQIHPYDNPDYPKTNGSPDPVIKVIRILDNSIPCILRSVDN